MQDDTLRNWFDANDIFSNEKLNTMIADTLSRYDRKRVEITEEEAEYLSAAGDANAVCCSVRKSIFPDENKE